MLTVRLDQLDLEAVSSPTDPTMASQVAFPVSSATGSTSSAVVYFEIEPGKRLGQHRDSAEEIVFVLAGEAEVTVEDEHLYLRSGELGVIPVWALHDVANVGQDTLRVIGFFGAATMVHAFQEPMFPGAEIFMVVHGPNGEEALASNPLGAPAAR